MMAADCPQDAAVAQRAHRRAAAARRAQRLGRVVGRAVVDIDDLVRHAGQRGLDLGDQGRDVGRLVAHGDDDGQQRGARRHPAPAAAGPDPARGSGGMRGAVAGASPRAGKPPPPRGVRCRRAAPLYRAPCPSTPHPRCRAHRRAPTRTAAPLARFLLVVAGLVWVMVAIGGATRLTGSGLSIMEWAPLAGILPPLSEAEWQRLYDLYRTIPQYALVNQGFGMEGFKQIFWLEWIHRFWGRLIGLAYVGGAGLVLAARAHPGRAEAAAAAAAGPGRAAGRDRLVHGRLGLRGRPHRGLALSAGDPPRHGLPAVRRCWSGRRCRCCARARRRTPRRAGAARRPVHAAAGLAVAAMLAGGFVAGIRAGFDYNTFPLMDGRLVPQGYWRAGAGLEEPHRQYRGGAVQPSPAGDR